jgi:hypothetical protein
VDPAGKAAAATEPTMAAMKGRVTGRVQPSMGLRRTSQEGLTSAMGEARRSHVGAAGRRRGQGGEGRG